jgi:Ca-activated chloride channel family protein
MRNLRLILLLTLVAGGAFAADFKQRLEQGNDLLRKGDTAGALKVFEDLQGEEPNAPDLLFSLGCARYQQAIENKDQKPEEVNKQLQAAREAFEKAETLSAGNTSANAGYNRSNALAQIAKRQDAQKDPKALEEAYRQSIQAYEQFLGRHPQHEKAQHNLDHMRYMLKREQQNPPPPQQSGSNDQQQDKGDQQKQQQNQGGQGQQDQQQNQQQGQNQNQQGQQDQQQQYPSEENQTPQQPQNKGSQQNNSQQDPNQQPMQGQQKAMLNSEQKDRQTVKSLLDSLENVDREEQKRLREDTQDRSIQEEWW